MSSFCSKNIDVIENTLATTVIELVINELVKLTMFRATGPRSSVAYDLHCLIVYHIYPKYLDTLTPYHTGPTS